jgi:predicted nucleotidyltransferase
VVGEQPYPLVFATVSGAHLYGFPSKDSDVDLRGAHLLPAAEVVGLRHGPETLDRSWRRGDLELDLVTHDIAKFARLLLGRNGYVLEQLLSPLVVTTSDAHRELVTLAPDCLTHHHAHHYHGFARTQWQLFERTAEIKPLLYTFRVLLTGAHLMRAGEVVAHLPTLLEHYPAPSYVADLVAAKIEAEHLALADASATPHHEQLADDVARLHAALDDARDLSRLPDRPAAFAALHDFVVRLRLQPLSVVD